MEVGARNRTGLGDTIARFDWRVGSSTPPRRALVSDGPLEPLLASGAGVLSLAVLAVGVLVLVLRRPRARTARIQA